MDDQLSGPHSIVTNGELFVTESTGNNSIIVYRQKSASEFKKIQEIPDVGKRPHRTVYDSVRSCFFVISGNDQTLHTFAIVNGKLKKIGSFSPPILSNQYVRSINVSGDNLYFVGNYNILIYSLCGNQIRLKRNIQLHQAYIRANDIFLLGNEAGFLTRKPKGMYFFSKIEELEKGTAKDVSKNCLGTPYYMSLFDDGFWVPEIDEHSRIVKYQVSNDIINFNDSSVAFDFGEPNQASISRKSQFPL